jgi:rare lipoprotein A
VLLIAIGFALSGCGSAPSPSLSDSGHHSRFRVGRPNYTVAPYQVNGVWYYPRVDYSYDQTGTASWYGPGFHGRFTSDGEVYDMNELTAAHKTLPLPSVVTVTNLQNGRELRLRVNDRGPFVGDRLIDVSRRAAQLLGFEGSGTAPVRVRILRDESIQVAQAAMHGGYGSVGIAGSAPAVQTQMAALPPPRRAPAPSRLAYAAPAQPAVSAPPPVAAPPPSAPEPAVAAAPAPEPARPEPVRMAALTPPPAIEPPPRAAAAPRHSWPSLISQAHAETLHLAPPPSHSGGRIYIQAGAFAVPENAQRVRARIATLGSAEIVSTTVSGAPMYRVRLGPIGSEMEARRVLNRVMESGYPTARIVTD